MGGLAGFIGTCIIGPRVGLFKPEEKLAYWVVAGALERGELEPNAGHMELANFAATYEEDFYERVMDESPYAANDMGESTKPWKTQYNRLFEGLNRI